MISCQMLCESNSPHLSQICTGFVLLHHAGEIMLSQECRKLDHFDARRPQNLRDARRTHLRVIVNRNINLYYDCHDSYEIDESMAEQVDCYFKRSYARSGIPDSLSSKVFPLGLNYELYSDEIDSFEHQRFSSFRPRLRDPDKPGFRPTVENMQAVPNFSLERGLLFITRVWDPYDHPDRSEEKVAERIRINETRARCVELLRKEFDDCFLGGLVHTDYAERNYFHALLPDNLISEKKNYVELLKQYPVCVTTTGLHGSIGWKMGEYVAFSRAIVSERLNYEVPGDFEQGQNFLEFHEPERCVNAAHELLSDADLRHDMMMKNHDYYLSYLKPDAMIRRTLEIAFSNRN
jgi:hypothetical protein